MKPVYLKVSLKDGTTVLFYKGTEQEEYRVFQGISSKKPINKINELTVDMVLSVHPLSKKKFIRGLKKLGFSKKIRKEIKHKS